ncbi:MAG: dolichyl-phosphate beta-glucosyltransferase, partial [Candidatus Acidiferrales bacterium]
MNARLGLSIIIPAYNEERRLPRTLERVRGYLRDEKAAAEVIVVDDGSSDGTREVVAQFQNEMPELRLVSNGQNRGKGYSVRHGMLEARGRVALFTDADLSAPIEEAGKLLEALETADVAIGSRALDRNLIEVHQSKARELAGILFNWMVRLYTGLRFQDTQCGFKAFAMPETRIIFEQQRIEDFGFDPEILFLARRHGLRAVEVPVRWAHDAATKVHVMRDSARMFADLLQIRWNAAA